MKYLVGLVLILLVAAGGAWVVAGRMPAPSIAIEKPEKFVGTSTPLQITITAPNAPTMKPIRVVFEQNGKQTPLFSLDEPGKAQITQDGTDKVRITHELGKQTVPDLQAGAAKIIVTAGRPVMRGMRTLETTASHDVQVRLERPRVSVISTHHYVNLGGTEFIVYRATPDDVESGVVVGDIEYPGYPAAGATVEGVKITDPAVRVAFFALLYDQDLNTPMRVYARDPAGNTARADFDHRTFPKPFKKSSIPIDDKLLDRVVPAILEGTTEVKPEGDNLAKFLVINGELRRKNAEKIASFAKQSSRRDAVAGCRLPRVHEQRRRVRVCRPSHLHLQRQGSRQAGAPRVRSRLVQRAAPIVAANRGKVLFADELGIYGNCVIVDHGMGVQSLYAHLSSIEVKAGQDVEKEQTLGRSGMTGLAGGDHLHFTMLVNGHMVNPVEWWDSHWIEDRILRKLRSTGGT